LSATLRPVEALYIYIYIYHNQLTQLRDQTWQMSVHQQRLVEGEETMWTSREASAGGGPGPPEAAHVNRPTSSVKLCNRTPSPVCSSPAGSARRLFLCDPNRRLPKLDPSGPLRPSRATEPRRRPLTSHDHQH